MSTPNDSPKPSKSKSKDDQFTLNSTPNSPDSKPEKPLPIFTPTIESDNPEIQKLQSTLESLNKEFTTLLSTINNLQSREQTVAATLISKGKNPHNNKQVISIRIESERAINEALSIYNYMTTTQNQITTLLSTPKTSNQNQP